MPTCSTLRKKALVTVKWKCDCWFKVQHNVAVVFAVILVYHFKFFWSAHCTLTNGLFLFHNSTFCSNVIEQSVRLCPGQDYSDTMNIKYSAKFTLYCSQRLATSNNIELWEHLNFKTLKFNRYYQDFCTILRQLQVPLQVLKCWMILLTAIYNNFCRWCVNYV